MSKTSHLTSIAKKKAAIERPEAKSFVGDTPENPAKSKGETKRLNVEIPAELHKHLRHLALEQDCTVKDLVLRAIRDSVPDLNGIN